MARFGTFFHGKMARQEHACLTSFVRHGHEVSVFSYEPLELPPGVAARDAAEILPRHRLYLIERGIHRGTVSQFSDHFRYCMIRDTGLVWIDTDIVCLRPDWPDREWLLAGQDTCMVNGAVLGVPPAHPLLDDAITVSERLEGVGVWALIGPHLLTALVHEHDVERELLPVDAFYPIHFSKASELLRPLGPGERLTLPREALGIHLWNEVLRMNGHDRTADPPPGSALEALILHAEGSG